MAKIIPEIKDLYPIMKHSYAEYEIILELQKLDPIKTKDWIIYYSFYFKGSKRYESHVNNEIDFLLLIPNGGIFTFEIKGGNIENTGTGLKSIDKHGKSYEIDPYNQSKNNFYALEDALKQIYPGGIGNKKLTLSNFKSGSLVGFPDINNVPNVGPISTKIDTYVRGMNLFSFIMGNVHYYLQKNDKKVVPNLSDINDICEKLSGENYIYTLSKDYYIKSINLKLNDLTEEQKTIFKGLLYNDRCLISGGPGTGKTVLCEFLYKELIKQKYSVVYFSFNKLISERLKNDLSINGGECYPIIEFIQNEYERLTNTKVEIQNYEEKKKFLLKNISKLIDDSVLSKTYDCIIIDEAQDISDDQNMIDFLDLLLNKGLKNGKCYFFYDEAQDIFNSKKDKKIYDNEIFGYENGCYRYARFNLERNCRNGEDVKYILKELNYSRKNNLSIAFNNINKEWYKEINEDINGAMAIKSLIDSLNSQGVKNKNITLLFNYNENNSGNIILKELKKIYGQFINKYSVEENKYLTYETVSRFKGLENDIIIYVNDNSNTRIDSHYVAISRARVFTYIYKVIPN